MALSLYYVDKTYIEYLQNIERNSRGFTHVPVTSYSKKQPDNILVEVSSDRIKPVKGSLRFNYMFPAPKECINKLIIANEPDSKRKSLLNKELNFILNNETRILNKAKQTYSKVTNKVNDFIVTNSCDFALLEVACNNYST